MQRKDILPKQILLGNNAIETIRMKHYKHSLSSEPHRHDHYTLMFITEGDNTQKQSIDTVDFDMLTDRLFFLYPGQIHTMKNFERDGWLILFDDVIFNMFLHFHPLEENTGILNMQIRKPYVDLNPTQTHTVKALIELLDRESKNIHIDGNIIAHLISLLILNANRAFDEQNHLPSVIGSEYRQTVIQLSRLIDDNFKKQQGAPFYAQQLHIQIRRLNEISKAYTGSTVHELIIGRLLTESKILLRSTSLSIKEICFELGFSDPAYYNRFFKKATGKTPAEFRKQNSWQ